MPPDVAVVFPEASPRGGVERVAWDLMAYLADHRDVVFVGHTAPDGLPPGVLFVKNAPSRLAPSALTLLSFRRGAERRVGSLAPRATISLGVAGPASDVVWVQSIHSAWLRVARRSPRASRSLPPGLRYLMPRHVVRLGLERRSFRGGGPRSIICTSHREVEDLVEIYGVDPATATVLPNPFDPQVFNIGRRSVDRPEARARMGVGDSGVALLFVANELGRKGFGLVLEALARVGDDRLSLHLVGRAAPTRYTQTIESLGLKDHVRYHGPTNDVGWWMSGADLLILPTQYEPFGLVVVEALASGVPVITTRVAGAADAVQPGRTGLIQEDPHDASELASLLETAVGSDLEAWGRTAAASVDAYRRDTVMARVEEIALPD